MAVTDFYGWSEADLLSALRKAQEDLAAGSSIISAGAGDVSTARMIQANARQRIRDLQQALYQVDKTAYEEFKHINASRTIASFTSLT